MIPLRVYLVLDRQALVDFTTSSRPLRQANSITRAMTWASERWSDDHVGTAVIHPCHRGSC